MHMVLADQSRVDLHLLTPRNIPEQLPAPLPYIPAQHLIAIFRRPYQVIFEVPGCMTSSLVVPQLNEISSIA